MLGTGTPVPDPERSGPAVAIVVDDTSYLFDFGPGTVRQASSFSPRFGGKVKALDAGQLKVAFLTHLHADHSAGLADLILTGWTLNRDEPLQIYGPDGTNRLVDGVVAAFDADIKYRLYSLDDNNNTGWRTKVTTVREGLVYQDRNVAVTAFPVIHGSWPNAYGYRVETEDRTIVISGDASPNEKILEYSRNTDYLIHEVYCAAGLEKNLKHRSEYHKRNHTSGIELAELANQVKPGVLVLTHILWFGCTPDEVMNEVTSHYDGNVIMADDLDVYE